MHDGNNLIIGLNWLGTKFHNDIFSLKYLIQRANYVMKSVQIVLMKMWHIMYYEKAAVTFRGYNLNSNFVYYIIYNCMIKCTCVKIKYR